MKSFQEWQRERKIESDKFGKANFVIFVLSFLAYFLALYLQFSIIIAGWIMPAALTVQLVLVLMQWRKSSQESRLEKLEMEQRFAREDMELNATVLLPPER